MFEAFIVHLLCYSLSAFCIRFSQVPGLSHLAFSCESKYKSYGSVTDKKLSLSWCIKCLIHSPAFFLSVAFGAIGCPTQHNMVQRAFSFHTAAYKYISYLRTYTGIREWVGSNIDTMTTKMSVLIGRNMTCAFLKSFPNRYSAL